MPAIAHTNESLPASAHAHHRALSRSAIFAVSCAVLILEVALTRVFSFVLWYHLTYLVVSLALLGYGAAGTVLATRAGFATANYPLTVARCCAIFSLLTMAAVSLAVRFPSDPEKLFEGQYRQIATLFLTHLTLALPFFFAGMAVGFVLMRNRQHTNQLYAADLCGAGLGSFLSVLLINRFGAISAILFAATLAALAAMGAAWKRGSAARATYTALFLLLAAGSTLSLSRDPIRLRISQGKDLTPKQDQIIFTGWNIVSRIDVTTPVFERAHFGGRISDAYPGPLPWVLPIFQDATAPTALVKVDGEVSDYALLDYYLQGAPYVIRRRPESVLIIGVGGGIDALIALHAGARRVVGVDVNPTMIDLIERRYRNFASGLFQRGNVELVVSEGRHYLTRSSETFDVIQLSGVDTYAALSAGAFVLAENYLYTEEAVRDLLRRLSEQGVLSYSRWLFTPPRETLKLVVTACEALRTMGINDPERHFFIVAGGPVSGRWADTMVKRSPFTQEEILALRAWAEQKRFEVIYDPAQAAPNPFHLYLKSEENEQRSFLRSYLYDISSSRDDRPFFFQFYRWRHTLHPQAIQGEGGYAPVKMPKGLLSLLLTLVELVLFSVAFVLFPLKGRQHLGLASREVLPWLVSFVGTGLGFIALEMVLIQKLAVFTGGPAYSLAVTLFALLVFSGLGSRLAQRLLTLPLSALARALALLLVTLVFELCFLDFALPALLFLPHAWRCVAAVLAIAPLGLLLGMPFPTLLAKAGAASPALVPWGWGVNACATVVGSVLAIMVSLQAGFNVTWLLATGLYALVLMVVATWLREGQSPA